VHWPQGIAARGELRHDAIHFLDVGPTIVELTGAKLPAMHDGQPVPPRPGKSLVPAFAKEGAIGRESLWWLHEGNRAIRVGPWKLVAAKGDPWELYDLAKDRSEMHNLATSLPDKVRELEARWTTEMEAMNDLSP
jgi:arylsulfatase